MDGVVHDLEGIRRNFTDIYSDIRTIRVSNFGRLAATFQKLQTVSCRLPSGGQKLRNVPGRKSMVHFETCAYFWTRGQRLGILPTPLPYGWPSLCKIWSESDENSWSQDLQKYDDPIWSNCSWFEICKSVVYFETCAYFWTQDQRLRILATPLSYGWPSLCKIWSESDKNSWSQDLQKNDDPIWSNCSWFGICNLYRKWPIP